MASRTYNIAFEINGRLNGQFGAALRAAMAEMQKMQSSARAVNAAMQGSLGTIGGYLQRLNSIASKSSQFANLNNKILQNENELKNHIANNQKLGDTYRNQKTQVDALRPTLESMKSTKSSLQGVYTREQNTLRGMTTNLNNLKAQYEAVKISQGANSTQAQQLKLQINSLNSSITSQKDKVAAAKESLNQIKTAVKMASEEFKKLESDSKNSGNAFNQSSAKIKSLQATLQQQKAALESLKSSLNGAGFNTSQFIQSEMRLRQEIEATTRALERQRQIAAQLTAAHDRATTAQTNLSDAQNLYSNVKGAVESVADPFIDATKNAMTFEKAMSKVKSTTQMRFLRNGDFEQAEKNMAELTALAEHLGATTEFTSTEVAQAMDKYG